MPLFSNDINRDFLVLPGGCGLDNRAHGFRDAALAANDLAHVILIHVKLQRDLTVFLLLLNADIFRMIH